MQGERTRDREALINRYGLSMRMAARAVALMARQVDITGTLLELAASDTALESVLLDSHLLTGTEDVDEEWLRNCAREARFRDADLLRFVSSDEGWRTIALEDDVLAAEAEQGQRGDAALIRVAPGGISRLETEGLFTPEEVGRLKLAALTSQNPDERIEALRKLVFAPLGGAQKASIFVSVLVDEAAEPKVRREAIRCLEQIGFRMDLAEAVRLLFEADEENVLYAIQRLASLLGDAQEAERGVVLAVILKIFDESDHCPVILAMLRLTAASAGVLAQSPQRTEQFIQSALRHLTRYFEPLSSSVAEAVRACHRAAPDAVSALLWKEIERSTDPRVRGLLIYVMTGFPQDREKLEKLAELAVSEILDPRLPEGQRAHLRYGAVRMGEPAVQAIRLRISSAKGRESAELVRLLDVICTEGQVSEQTVNDAVGVLLDQLKIGDKATRRRILEASLPADRRVEESLRRKVAAEMLPHLTEFGLRSTIDSLCVTLERIGIPAVEPLLDYARRRHGHDEVEDAFLTLGRIAGARGAELPDELAERAIEFCMSLFADERERHGAFTIALAYLCGYTRPGRQHFDAALCALKERLWKVKYTFDIFDALGIMAGSDNAEPQHQRELFGMFDQLVTAKAPEVSGVKRKTEAGTVYVFGLEVLFDTRVLPAVVRGLERIAVCRHTPAELRTDVVKRLLVLWEGVSNVRVVWGPAAMDALIHAIAAAACCAEVGVQMRVRLGRSLLRFLKKLGVARSMGDICSRADGNVEMQALAVEAGEKMLAEWETCDEQDDERRAALLQSLGKLAANTELNAQDAAVQLLRENVLQALFRGLREGIGEVRTPLEALRDCPDLTQKQRDEIRDRLGSAFGLART